MTAVPVYDTRHQSRSRTRTPSGSTPAGGAGRFPRVGARHLRSRAASARYVRPAPRPVCELELAELGQEGAGNAREKGARPFEPSGPRAPTVSREVRKLKLSGGVRSRPQAPWWNADRRARPHGRVPRREVRRLLNSVCRRSALLFVIASGAKQSRVTAADSGLLRRCAPRNDEVYPRKILTAAGPTTGAI